MLLNSNLKATLLDGVFLMNNKEFIIDTNNLIYVKIIGGIDQDDKFIYLTNLSLLFNDYYTGKIGNFSWGYIEKTAYKNRNYLIVDRTCYYYNGYILNYSLTGGIYSRDSSIIVDYIKGLFDIIKSIENYEAKIKFLEIVGFCIDGITLNGYNILTYNNSSGVKHTYTIIVDNDYNVVDVRKVSKQQIFVNDSCKRYILYISLITGNLGLYELGALNNNVLRDIIIKKLKVGSAIRKVLTGHNIRLDGSEYTLYTERSTIGKFKL